MKGLYLAAPHGRLVHDGSKKAIAVAKPVDIEGSRLLCSKEDGSGLCYGLVEIGPPAHCNLDTFDDQFATHQVTRSSRTKWWPQASKLLVYPILRFEAFSPPEPIEVLPGVTMNMGDVTFLNKEREALLGGLGEGGRDEKVVGTDSPLDPLPPGVSPSTAVMSSSLDPSLVIPKDYDTMLMSSPPDLKETAMPWTTDNPPSPAKNWTAEEKKKCVSAANAVLAKDGSEQDAIFACIRAAGKTKNPGGKSINPDDFAVAYDLVHGYLDAEKAGDDGDGELHVCTCPNCGAKTDLPLGEPCRENECTECGARLRGGGDETEEKSTPEEPEPVEESPTIDPTASLHDMENGDLAELKDHLETALSNVNDTHKPTVQAAIDAVAQEQESRIPLVDEDKVGKSLTDKVIQTVKNWLSSLTTRPPDVTSAITILGRKDSSDPTWFAIWPTNTYFDREGEAFTTPSLNDFVARHESKDVKGEAWVWHVPGSKFGTIHHQAIVAEHFLCQLGTFDDTVVGNAMKGFFSLYPDGHPVIAPEGWGASHGYNYKLWDRLQDGVYNWFDTVESSVLPQRYAANPFNPKLEVLMNDKQRELFDEVGKQAGVSGLADLIAQAGEEKKVALLQAEQEHKSLADATPPNGEGEKAKKPPEQVPDKDDEEEEEDESQEKKPKEKKDAEPVPDQVATIAQALEDRFQFENLSKMLEDQAATIKALQTELEATKSTLAERSDEQEVAARVAAAPQYAWFSASKAAETVLQDNDPLDQELKARQPQVSPTVSKIASKLG